MCSVTLSVRHIQRISQFSESCRAATLPVRRNKSVGESIPSHLTGVVPSHLTGVDAATTGAVVGPRHAALLFEVVAAGADVLAVVNSGSGASIRLLTRSVIRDVHRCPHHRRRGVSGCRGTLRGH